MAIHFGGINFCTKNPEKVYEFYKNMGLEIKEEPDTNDEHYGASFALGGDSTLWIWRSEGVQLVIGCDDMDETYAELSAKGYAVTPPELMFYGGREMTLTDPMGNKILFLD